MSIDPSTLGTIAGGGVGGVGVWFVVKAIFGKVETLQKDFDDYKVKIAEKYVTVESMKDMEQRLEKRFDRLEGLLNGRGD